MTSLVIFLNELSFAPGITMSSVEMLPHVLSTLATVKAAKKIRNDLVIAGHARLASIVLGDGTHSLATVLRDDPHKEEWRFIRGLDQSSPWDAYPSSIIPGDFQEVMFQGRTAIGMLWAKQNESTTLSFAFLPDWEDSHLKADFREMGDTGNIISIEVAIPNLSKPEHITTHRTLIEGYGQTMSASSLVYEGDGFVVRMFFDDHDPPHFHVLMRRNTSETLAKYAIETLDLLSGSLPPAVRKRVAEWAERHRDDLNRSWARCRMRQHPFFIEE